MSGTVYGDCEEVCVGAYLFTTKKGCCDDEQSIRQMLKKKIKEMYPNMTVVQFGSGREFLLSDYNPDILLLDIQMPGENGMETAKEFRIKRKKSILIFVTALEEYVFDAFDVGVFHYLVKPMSNSLASYIKNRSMVRMNILIKIIIR